MGQKVWKEKKLKETSVRIVDEGDFWKVGHQDSSWIHYDFCRYVKVTRSYKAEATDEQQV